MIRPAALAILIAATSARVWAQGGPPMITDDPDTPGPGYWEINAAYVKESGALQRHVEAPLLDLNYGVGRRVQLKLEMPWVRVGKPRDASQAGAGAATVGVKWRFVGQEGTRLAWSIYPQLQFNTSHSSVVKGIVDEGGKFLFPTELTVEFAHVEINAEAGRNFVEHRRDNWIAGVSTEAGVAKRLELLGELHAEQVPGEAAERFVNVGARPRLTRQIAALVAAGRTLDSSKVRMRVYLYTGLQFNLPSQFSFKDVNRTTMRPGR